MYLEYQNTDTLSMTRTSTQYYRENRNTRRVVYKCPHCAYETANCQIAIKNHINAKHTPEHERPFQCQMCPRGFAQKAHLHIHCKKVHDKNIPQHKLFAVAYIINILEKNGKSKKTKARQVYYKNHSVINSKELTAKKHEYLPGVFMKQHDIHYDQKNGFIKMHKCSLWKKIVP